MEKIIQIDGWTDKNCLKHFDTDGLIEFFGAFKTVEPFNGWVDKPVKVRVTVEII